jgi:hypothetical protein
MKKTLIARKPLIVITLDRGKDGLYTGEMAPFCAIDDTLFVRRVLCCCCYKRVGWTEAARNVKYVKTDVPCKTCRTKEG